MDIEKVAKETPENNTKKIDFTREDLQKKIF